MQIQWKRHDGVLEVSVRGELDAENVEDVLAFFQEREGKDEKRIVLDLSELEYVDSSGLGVFVRIMKVRRNSGGDVRIAAPTAEVRKVLELTRLNRVFEIFPSVEEATEKFCTTT